jgi:hypothetical protein
MLLIFIGSEVKRSLSLNLFIQFIKRQNLELKIFQKILFFCLFSFGKLDSNLLQIMTEP